MLIWSLTNPVIILLQPANIGQAKALLRRHFKALHAQQDSGHMIYMKLLIKTVNRLAAVKSYCPIKQGILASMQAIRVHHHLTLTRPRHYYSARQQMQTCKNE